MSIKSEGKRETTGESPELFASRKVDHIRLALDQMTQASGGSGIDQIELAHEAFPELDLNDVNLQVPVLGRISASPFFISSMTAGHEGSLNLNLVMAKAAEEKNWLMAVGSQRRQLTDPQAALEWKKIRAQCPRVRFIGNIGLAQLIQTEVSEVRRLADSLEAEAMIVHTNPLQECLQPEGTPQFKGGLQALERLARELGLPVIVKETGCGFSKSTLNRLGGLGLYAVDVSGFGGTHWGRVEGGRSKPGEMRKAAAETFKNWGISTVESLQAAIEVGADYEVWASGGVRSGLDAAKLLALGAEMVGLAQPVIAASLQGAEALFAKMELLEFELRTALFCTGQRTVADLQENRSTVVKVGSQTGKQAGNTTVDRADNNRSRSGI